MRTEKFTFFPVLYMQATTDHVFLRWNTWTVEIVEIDLEEKFLNWLMGGSVLQISKNLY
jgi:hypothetical protein